MRHPARFPPVFWAVAWEPRRYVLTQVSLKNRREPGARGLSEAVLPLTKSSRRSFAFWRRPLRLDLQRPSQPGELTTAGPSTPQIIALR